MISLLYLVFCQIEIDDSNSRKKKEYTWFKNNSGRPKQLLSKLEAIDSIQEKTVRKGKILKITII